MQDEILRLIPEPADTVPVDRNAVAVMKGWVVGHVPFKLAPISHCS